MRCVVEMVQWSGMCSVEINGGGVMECVVEMVVLYRDDV